MVEINLLWHEFGTLRGTVEVVTPREILASIPQQNFAWKSQATFSAKLLCRFASQILRKDSPFNCTNMLCAAKPMQMKHFDTEALQVIGLEASFCIIPVPYTVAYLFGPTKNTGDRPGWGCASKLCLESLLGICWPKLVWKTEAKFHMEFYAVWPD